MVLAASKICWRSRAMPEARWVFSRSFFSEKCLALTNSTLSRTGQLGDVDDQANAALDGLRLDDDVGELVEFVDALEVVVGDGGGVDGAGPEFHLGQDFVGVDAVIAVDDDVDHAGLGHSVGGQVRGRGPATARAAKYKSL